MTGILKLGGSVVTDKANRETIDESAIEAAVAAIAGREADIVLVHGGGSFGHPAAADHGIDTAAGTTDAAAVRDVHDAMVRLNDEIVDRLAAAGVPAVPVHPLSSCHREPDGTLAVPKAVLERLLEAELLPVLHGDVIAHAGRGVTVLSGDDLVAALAESLGADRVGVCSTEPGVLDQDGAIIERVTALDDVHTLGESSETDVTGGMAGKVETLLSLDRPSAIFGPDDLESFLAGDLPGTTVSGR